MLTCSLSSSPLCSTMISPSFKYRRSGRSLPDGYFGSPLAISPLQIGRVQESRRHVVCHGAYLCRPFGGHDDCGKAPQFRRQLGSAGVSPTAGREVRGSAMATSSPCTMSTMTSTAIAIPIKMRPSKDHACRFVQTRFSCCFQQRSPQSVIVTASFSRMIA